MIRAENIISALRDAGENMSDGLLVATILNGLPDSFRPLAVHVTQNEDNVIFKRLITDLRVSSVQCGLSGPAESSSTPESCPSLVLRSSSVRLEELEAFSPEAMTATQPSQKINRNMLLCLKEVWKKVFRNVVLLKSNINYISSLNNYYGLVYNLEYCKAV